jgi:hypothetical protein
MRLVRRVDSRRELRCGMSTVSWAQKELRRRVEGRKRLAFEE